MRKMLKIGIFCILFLLCDCQVLAQKCENAPNEAIQKSEKKEEILSAFSFWVNKNCWLYGSSEYADVKNKIKVYYKDKNTKEYYGYLFIKTKTGYDKLAFLIKKNEGYQSEPLSVKRVKKIGKKLSYLGNDTFFFDSHNAEQPQFPKSSKKKAAFIKRAKKKIKKLLSPNANSKKINYEIYILDFTNADISADVIVIENSKKMWLSEVVSEVKWDDGKTRKNLAQFQGQKSPIIDWTNAKNRTDFKKQLEMSVCKFNVGT